MEFNIDDTTGVVRITGEFDETKFGEIMAQLLPEHKLICMPSIDEVHFTNLGRTVSYVVQRTNEMQQVGTGFIVVPGEIEIQHVSAVISE